MTAIESGEANRPLAFVFDASPKGVYLPSIQAAAEEADWETVSFPGGRHHKAHGTLMQANTGAVALVTALHGIEGRWAVREANRQGLPPGVLASANEGTWSMNEPDIFVPKGDTEAITQNLVNWFGRLAVKV